MQLGIVQSAIHSTINHPFYNNRRLLIVDRTEADGSPLGKYIIAVDTVDAGPGDRVLVLDEGNGARQVLADADGPVRSVIVGIVDETTTSEPNHPRPTISEPGRPRPRKIGT